MPTDLGALGLCLLGLWSCPAQYLAQPSLPSTMTSYHDVINYNTPINCMQVYKRFDSYINYTSSSFCLFDIAMQGVGASTLITCSPEGSIDISHLIIVKIKKIISLI